MKTKTFILMPVLFLLFLNFVQAQKKMIPLNSSSDLVQLNVKYSEKEYLGKKSLEVFDSGSNSDLKLLKINNAPLKNGTIEINLAGNTMANASETARGFVGIAFRINNDNSKYECIYLRPTNGRANDQVRRNHSVQYISYPDYPWERLRKEFPEKYESYVDLEPGVWTKVKIVVEGNKAKLYVHDSAQPCLIVNDLIMGPNAEGKIGLWVGPGTIAHFADLYVTQ